MKTGKNRTLSSKLWLERQLNDPYVARAKREGYRSRAVYKLSEIDDKYRFLKPGGRVVDLGAAPGGWSQIAAKRTGADGKGKGRVVAIDILDMDPVPGVDFLKLDFLDPAAPDILKERLGGKADVVLSDMAANATGHRKTDHLKIVALVEAAAEFASEVLAAGRHVSRQGDSGRHRGRVARHAQARFHEREACEAAGEPRQFRRALYACDRLSRAAKKSRLAHLLCEALLERVTRRCSACRARSGVEPFCVSSSSHSFTVTDVCR